MTETPQPVDPQAALIHVNGTIEFVPFPLDQSSRDELQKMYRLLQCAAVEAVTLDPITALMPDLEFMTLWIDEEGKYEPKPHNPVATWLCQRMYQAISDDDYIAGPAYLTGPADEDGETLPLPPESVEFLSAVASVIKEGTTQ
jgi:hypothetical protein